MSKQLQSELKAISMRYQYGFNVSLNRFLNAIPKQCQSDFKANFKANPKRFQSEFQSDFKMISKRFQSHFKAISARFQPPAPPHPQSPYRLQGGLIGIYIYIYILALERSWGGLGGREQTWVKKLVWKRLCFFAPLIKV